VFELVDEAGLKVARLRQLSLSPHLSHSALLIKMQKFYPMISFQQKKDFNTILIDLLGQLKMICIQN